MKITIKAFNREKHFDVAIDEDSGTCLIGIPFYYGPTEHTNYYVISKNEFECGVIDPSSLSDLVDGQTFKGKGRKFFLRSWGSSRRATVRRFD